MQDGSDAIVDIPFPAENLREAIIGLILIILEGFILNEWEQWSTYLSDYEISKLIKTLCRIFALDVLFFPWQSKIICVDNLSVLAQNRKVVIRTRQVYGSIKNTLFTHLDHICGLRDSIKQHHWAPCAIVSPFKPLNYHKGWHSLFCLLISEWQRVAVNSVRISGKYPFCRYVAFNWWRGSWWRYRPFYHATAVFLCLANRKGNGNYFLTLPIGIYLIHSPETGTHYFYCTTLTVSTFWLFGQRAKINENKNKQTSYICCELKLFPNEVVKWIRTFLRGIVMSTREAYMPDRHSVLTHMSTIL